MYGDQQAMKTMTITNVILTVLTLARGIIPRELARRLSLSSSSLFDLFRLLFFLSFGILYVPLAHIVLTMMA
jgi:predicted Kef-type K+ transport protein